MHTSCCWLTCPLYISKIQQATTQLGSPAAGEVVPVAVTVDPDRDTVERLRQHTSNLIPNWLFLGEAVAHFPLLLSLPTTPFVVGHLLT